MLPFSPDNHVHISKGRRLLVKKLTPDPLQLTNQIAVAFYARVNIRVVIVRFFQNDCIFVRGALQHDNPIWKEVAVHIIT